ncbi:MAG: glycosyltransferase [Eubacteriales bacterium]|nr:glycosyltransferase [Eubacteriales bacterium]
MSGLNLVALMALICIWTLLLVNVTLTVAGYRYYVKTENTPAPELSAYPMVSVLIPAHNEAQVIVQTVTSILRFDYPADRYEIIVINDNSSDNSAALLETLRVKNPEHKLKIISTDAATGGKGKSNALNIGLKQAEGELLAIYDADNTPERGALRILVAELMADDRLGAVIGKFRTRNRNASLFTRFINIETLAFQWMAQAGRWQLFKLCTIPGTNFVIRREIIDAMGGWDTKALAEDTEISFRIYMMGYLIKMQPKAVTWEQEPQVFRVWFKQRTRWVKGNIYVLIKNIPLIFRKDAKRIRFDIIYFLCIYFLLLMSLLFSDFMLLGDLTGILHSTLAGFSILLWLMAILLFVVGTFVTILTEPGEMSLSNFLLIILMYFTYSKLWMVVAFAGLLQYIGDMVLKRETKWYKTERFET